MANITNSTPSTAWGGPFSSPDWNYPDTHLFFTDSGVFSWVRFDSFNSAISGTITAATLTIGNIGSPGTGEILSVQADITSADNTLPSTLSDTNSRSLSMGNVQQNVNGLNTANFDVLSLVLDIQTFIGGGVIMFKVENASYSGSALSSLTASLSVDYTAGGGSGFGCGTVNILQRMSAGFVPMASL